MVIAKKLFGDDVSASKFSFSSHQYHSKIYLHRGQSDSLRQGSERMKVGGSVELGRGKSLSSSSTQLFREAHSVQRE